MSGQASRTRSVPAFTLLVFGLSTPIWALGATIDVELFPGLKLFQLSLAMPAVAALILSFREGGRDAVASLLKRTYDIRKFGPKIWYLPVFLIYPSIGLLDVLIQRLLGTPIPSPHFSLIMLIGYSMVFFLTIPEELGLTGYATDTLQERYSALMSGIAVGLIWAGYHIPSFIISGYYTYAWMFWHALYTVAGRVLFVWVYNNSGKSLMSMALLHSTFGVFWILWPPTGNLQKAPDVYDPRIAALIAVSYAAVVTFLWGFRTLARFRFARPGSDLDQAMPADR